MKKLKRCDAGDFAVKYGEWIEVFDEQGQFVYSFKATSNMCESVLKRFLVFRAGMEPEAKYTIKRRSK